MAKTGAQLVVECLEALDVKIIFGIPGAKIDAVFNALVDSKIRLVVCRHEQNAAFMAAAHGRLTGKPGVVLVTSGPGVSNLTTGLLTATTEGDPIIAIGGNVPRAMLLKESHQNTNSVKILEAATKSAVELNAVENIPEAFANAYRTAIMPRSGACFISLPQDILTMETNCKAIKETQTISYAGADTEKINQAAKLLNKAKFPLLFLGEEASRPENAMAIRELLKQNPMPTIGTYQAAGVVSRELVENFMGRVGLFKNQIGDQVLDEADAILCVGFNPVEYDPEVWNAKQKKKIIHLDYLPASIHSTYQPTYELLGDIKQSLNELSEKLQCSVSANPLEDLQAKHHEYIASIQQGKQKTGSPIHPLRFIYELREKLGDDDMVICDIGTVYMWMARYFLCYQPHHLLFSNGQQTLGVGLPWALSTSLSYPKKRIVSVSGDGGFLFSAMELETAVREKADFVHFIWRDGTYNMVLEQELMKYNRKSGVDFGKVNIPDFASAFGAKGLELNSPDDFDAIYKEAMETKGPVLVDVPIDYSDNPELFITMHDNIIH